MYKFKSSLIGLIGLLTLGLITTVVVPHIGRGAIGTTNNGPTSQTQNVNVVNTPAVNAQQSGTWNVGINGTPTVAVSNFPATTSVGIDTSANTVKIDMSKPLPVRDVDNPARQPIELSFVIIIQDGSVFGSQAILTVPTGKVFVLEQASVYSRLNGQRLVSARLRRDEGPPHFLVLNDAGLDASGQNVFVAGQQVRLYFNEGEQVVCIAERNSSAGQGNAQFTVSGYLLDKL